MPNSAWRKSRSPRITPRKTDSTSRRSSGANLPAETDIYIVARDGKEMRLPAEEGIILDMNVERKRMTVDAERVFELLKEE